MNHDRSEAYIGLLEAMQLMDALGNEGLINPLESEKTYRFKRDVLQVLREHCIAAADLEKPVYYEEGQSTLFQLLLTEVPWNVVVLLRDWMSRYNVTGYDFVAAWAETQDFQAG
jgi:hypothetical protein